MSEEVKHTIRKSYDIAVKRVGTYAGATVFWLIVSLMAYIDLTSSAKLTSVLFDQLHERRNLIELAVSIIGLVNATLFAKLTAKSFLMIILFRTEQ